MKNASWVMLILLILLVSGVGEGTDKVDVRTYFPADRDLIWVYEGAGNEFAGFSRRVMFRQGDRAQMVEDNTGTRTITIFRITSEAVTKIFSRPECYTDQSLLQETENRGEILLKAPLRQGAAWKSDGYRREIVSLAEKVTVPAGTFEAVLKVRVNPLSSMSRGVVNEYYVAGTGLILREYIAPDDYKITSALKSMVKPAGR